MNQRWNAVKTIKPFVLVAVIFSMLLSIVGGVTANDYAAQSTSNSNQPQAKWSSETIVTVSNDVKVNNVKRLGINIGSYSQYGAGQYLKNLIPNPGLESGEFAMIFLAARGANSTRVQPNRWAPPWNAQADGFWDSAQYEILSGPAAGRTGTVRQFRREGGKYTFYLNNNPIKLQERDAVMVYRKVPGYFSETPTKFHEAEPNQTRPGSPGRQSLRIHNSGWQPGFGVPFDSFARDADRSAGKMRIVEGNWHYEIWVRAEQPNMSLEVKFHRVQEKVFHQEVIPLTTRWQKIERRFFIPSGSDSLQVNRANPLAFELRIAEGPKNADILFDDLELSSLDQRNPTEFSDKFIQQLRELNPGVIRFWGKQLGSSLDNQIAEPWARKTVGHDPHEGTPHDYNYSLHEFLELAQYLGVEPWYVVPPTFTPAEMRNLVAYLSAPAGASPYSRKRAELGQSAPWTSVFPKIHIEYGNEMWGGNTVGDPFRGASFWNGQQIGEVANKRFQIMRSAPFFNQSKLNLVVGGQAGFAGRQQEIEMASSNHDTIAVAPYYASEMPVYNSAHNLYYSMFANATASVAANGKMTQSRNFIDANKNMAIYEINTHLNRGYMNPTIRNDFVTSQGAGLALPLHMLTYQTELGVRTQAAFTALQHSFEMPGQGGQRVKLWGVLRDVEATGLKRPTGLGMEIVNHAIKGDAITTVQSGSNPTWMQNPINGIAERTEVNFVQSFAFRQWKDYGLVLFNLHLSSPQTVKIELPSNVYGPAKMHMMTSKHINDDN